MLAGLRRRGWAGRLVWAFAPVQDRHAAPAIARAVQDLAAGGVDVIVVARGGGSLADLFAFCDETLCRTVALLPVPVIASVGHHTDRTLIDDVAAVSCSTPTHAAETAVGIDCARARAELLASAAAAVGAEPPRRARACPRPGPARPRPGRARGPPPALACTSRCARCAPAPAAGWATSATTRSADLLVLERKATAATGVGVRERARDLERLRLALDAHDPERTLERGFALVEDDAGEPVTSARRAAELDRLAVRFADGRLRVRQDRQERLF